MISYVIFLRSLAAILITNSHYIGVYPHDLIASGGLLGDVLFFALSGFVLVNIKGSFINWYKKRLLRIYPSIWIITLIYLLLGFYTFNNWTLVSYFIYPTYYHFVASIILLYIPYYFIAKNKYLRKRTPKIIIFTFLIQFLIYAFFYDKSYYHIDTVREPMIRFLFFQSMLLGLYFRHFHEKYVDKNRLENWILLFLSLVGYFSTKIIFSRFENLSQFQIINQIIIYIALYFMFLCFAGINTLLNNLSPLIKEPVNFIAKITLQIYAVQYVIITKFAHIVFPLNWIVITALIIVSAHVLFLVGTKTGNILERIIDNLQARIKRKRIA